MRHQRPGRGGAPMGSTMYLRLFAAESTGTIQAKKWNHGTMEASFRLIAYMCAYRSSYRKDVPRFQGSKWLVAQKPDSKINDPIAGPFFDLSLSESHS